jgi:hypothetical protein
MLPAQPLVGSTIAAGVAPPAGSPAPVAAPGFTSKCASAITVASATAQGTPGTCFRRCDQTGCIPATPSNFSPYAYYPQFGNGFLRQFNQFNQFNNIGYGMSYGLGQARLPSINPYFNAPRAQVTAPVACTAQQLCSCDVGCEGRGDCCFDYCSFCR